MTDLEWNIEDDFASIAEQGLPSIEKLKNSIFIHATNMNVDKHGNNNIGHCQNILNIIKHYLLEIEYLIINIIIQA